MAAPRKEPYALDRHSARERYGSAVQVGGHEVADNVSRHNGSRLPLVVENTTAASEAVLSTSGLAAVFFAYSLAFVLIVAGNVVAILVFTRGRRSKTDVRIFFINLAVADLIVGVVCLPISSVTSTFGWMLPEFMCPVVMYLQLTSVTTTVYMNCALSVDRFIAVKYPLRRLTLPKYYIAVVISVVWIVSAGVSSVQLAVSRVQAPEGAQEPVCQEDWGNDSFMKYYSIIVLVITYAIPACLLIVMYSLVCYELWRRRPPGTADEGRESRQLRSKKTVVRMLIIMAALFISSWLPLHLLFIYLHFYVDGDLEHSQTVQVAKYYYFAHLLAISSSFQNPIIYGFLNGNFRADLAELLIRCCPLVDCPAVIKRAAVARSTSASSACTDAAATAPPTKLCRNIVHALRGPSYRNGSGAKTCHRMLSNESCRSACATPEPPDSSSSAGAVRAAASWSVAVGSVCCLTGRDELASKELSHSHEGEARRHSGGTHRAATGDPGGVHSSELSYLHTDFKDDKYYCAAPGSELSESAPFISRS